MYCSARGTEAVVAKGFAEGGEGMKDAAKAVIQVAEAGGSKFKLLYYLALTIEEKIAVVAKETTAPMQ